MFASNFTCTESLISIETIVLSCRGKYTVDGLIFFFLSFFSLFFVVPELLFIIINLNQETFQLFRTITLFCLSYINKFRLVVKCRTRLTNSVPRISTGSQFLGRRTCGTIKKWTNAEKNREAKYFFSNTF